MGGGCIAQTLIPFLSHSLFQMACPARSCGRERAAGAACEAAHELDVIIIVTLTSTHPDLLVATQCQPESRCPRTTTQRKAQRKLIVEDEAARLAEVRRPAEVDVAFLCTLKCGVW